MTFVRFLATKGLLLASCAACPIPCLNSGPNNSEAGCLKDSAHLCYGLKCGWDSSKVCRSTTLLMSGSSLRMRSHLTCWDVLRWVSTPSLPCRIKHWVGFINRKKTILSRLAADKGPHVLGTFKFQLLSRETHLFRSVVWQIFWVAGKQSSGLCWRWSAVLRAL